METIWKIDLPNNNWIIWNRIVFKKAHYLSLMINHKGKLFFENLFRTKFFYLLKIVSIVTGNMWFVARTMILIVCVLFFSLLSIKSAILMLLLSPLLCCICLEFINYLGRDFHAIHKVPLSLIFHFCYRK